MKTIRKPLRGLARKWERLAAAHVAAGDLSRQIARALNRGDDTRALQAKRRALDLKGGPLRSELLDAMERLDATPVQPGEVRLLPPNFSSADLRRERDEARAVLRDLLEEKGLKAYRERLATYLHYDGPHHVMQHEQAIRLAIAWFDEATAGALKEGM